MTKFRGFPFYFNMLLRSALCAALVFTLVFSLTSSPAEAKSNPKYASLVMDADTGMILHQRYADKKLHPASLTKVMTLLMVFDALHDGRMKMTDRIRISHRAAGMQPSKLGLSPGSSIRVKDAIYSLVTKSANDIAVAVAEHIAGSESKFAAAMTRRARSIGMSRTNFRNASGLHHPKQISTARDIAKMARFVITKYPEYYGFFSRRSFTYAGKTYRNHNKLLGKYKGMDGMKTGYINASGYNLVASAVRNNSRIIGVVFGGRSGKTRNAHMRVLLDQGFNKVNQIKLANAKAPIPPRKPAILVAMNNQLNKITPASGSKLTAPKLASAAVPNVSKSILSGFKGNVFDRTIGGSGANNDDYNRFKTGLMAISAHTGKAISNPVFASYSPPPAKKKPWAIQIGAFATKVQTDRALAQSLRKLPNLYADAQTIVAPLRTRSGWLYRGRLKGYTRSEAFEACKYLPDCMPVAP